MFVVDWFEMNFYRMFSITEKKVRNMYARFGNQAIKAFENENYDKCLKYIKVVSYICYSFYLGFKDDKMEDMLESISHHILRTSKEKWCEDECAFFDSFSIDNGGLSMQYLGALMYCGYKILYISDRDGVQSDESAIGKMLRDYGKATVVVVPGNLNYFARAQFIHDSIMKSGASKLFVHSEPWASAACCAFYSLPKNITKYKINLTDHTFWLGTRFVDYSFEFRSYGCMLSCLRRGIASDSLLHLPFYPILNPEPFHGFPKGADNKVVLFSGGSYYKIFDTNDTFFKLVRDILDGCPDVVLLFAGSGDGKQLEQKLKQYKLEGRFIPIGHRSDITEVFKHCDIYLNTYPIGGGLMSQYAAQLGKPILSYHTSGITLIEECVCQIEKITISDDTFDAIVNRMKRLSKDGEYRRLYGERIQKCVITPEKFNQLFAQCMESGINPVPYDVLEPFKERKFDIKDKLAFENGSKDFQRLLLKMIGIPSLWQCPAILMSTLKSILKKNRLLKTIKGRF